MKIVIAPDSFKGNLDAAQVADAIAAGIREVLPEAEIIKVPMADGGEGTVRALVAATGGRLLQQEVTEPLGGKVKAEFGIIESEGRLTAVIEMAAASGLPLVPPAKRNPLLTTTYGTGELIRAGLDQGCREFIIGIGGSATVDGGAGMAQALGVELLDERGNQIGLGGGALKQLRRISLERIDPRVKAAKFIVACDVKSPLLGPTGAAYCYGPQKGATPQMVRILEEALAYYAGVIVREIGKDLKDLPGTGAAGGLGVSLLAFFDAVLKPGIEIVIEATHLEEKLRGANLVITGEGRIDSQTAQGKTPVGVAQLAKKYRIPVIALAGEIAPDAEIVGQFLGKP
jgi:glycerate kinase